MATTTLAATAYIHPHHGVALADASVEYRQIGGRKVAMQPLASAQPRSWAALRGVDDDSASGPDLSVQTLVPLDKLESGQTPWSRCPSIDLEALLDDLPKRTIVPWENGVEIRTPEHIGKHVAFHLGNVGVVDDPTDAVSEIVCQVADFLTLWQTVTLVSPNASQGSRRENLLADLRAAVRRGDPDLWSVHIGLPCATRVHGRELLGHIERVVALVAAATGASDAEVAEGFEKALSKRLCARFRDIESHSSALVASRKRRQ